MNRAFWIRWLACAALALMTLSDAIADSNGEIHYNRDVRPILSDTCFQCHGPDKAQRKAKLRLDVREAALEREAFVPGKPDESSLVKRLFTEDPEELMPPPEMHKPLSDAQKDVLKRWIAAGAPYDEHWAYLPIQRPEVPQHSIPGSSLLNPIDAFIQERLAKAGLAPIPEADRRTLLRRLSLDLTGLPPHPAVVEAFAKDTSPHAYERHVELLLASPHFGERMAVPWLDVVRFSDTVGYHGDQNQRIFPYRDYVIDAFNANKPFDQFTIEQLAGDLLPHPTPQQLVATGFNRLNMMTREGGAQPREYIAKYQADRVRTVSTAWLGATLACAECHDHKFDPFSTRDFYSLAAFFGDVQQWGVYSDYDYTPNPDLKGWSNDHPFPPEIEIPSPFLRRRLERLRADETRALTGATAALEMDASASLAYKEWSDGLRDIIAQLPDGWRPATIVAMESMEGTNFVASAHASLSENGSVLFSTTNATTDRVVLAPPAGWLAAIRLELLPTAADASNLRGDRRTANVQLSMSVRRAGTSNENPVSFTFADAVGNQPRFDSGHDILGIVGGWKTRPGHASERQVGIWLLDRPFRLEAGDALTVTLPNNAVAQLGLAVSPLAAEPSRWDETTTELQAALLKNPAVPPALFHRSSAWNADLTRRLRALDAEMRECRNGRAWSMVTVATNALVTRVLPRGNWMDESGSIVEPATPHFLPPHGQPRGLAGNKPGLNQASGPNQPGTLALVSDRSDRDAAAADPRRDSASSPTRLDLARWLVSTENPLTARNFVNRLWSQFFGAGISARLEDLGLQGEWPTHPELLDWLAAEFMRPEAIASPLPDIPRPQSWDVKHLVRLIVNSATYRQDSVPSEKARELDPANKLFARQSPRRLEAEFVRDNALSIAGLIDLEIGGPSAFPYQSPGYYANLQFPDRDYVASPDERQYRRGIYMHWQRTFLHPMLANFDAQSREECVAARMPSNTPQQALTLLNDPTFVEAGRVLAEHAFRSGTDEPARIRFLFREALSREPKPVEQASLSRLLEELRRTYAASPDDAGRLLQTGQAPVPADLPKGELAAWANIARVVLNLHESITRY